MEAILEYATKNSTKIIIVCAVLCLALVVFLFTRKKKTLTTRALVAGAISIALSFVLSYIKLYHMPQGGSVTPASMLPVMMYAYSFGFFPGLICSVAYGMLQLIQDAYVVHPVQLLLDYPLAFGSMAIAAFGRYIKNDTVGLPLAALAGGLLRTCFHILSGMIFFAEYAAQAGQTPFVYSSLYNLSSIGVDTLICVVIICVPQVRNAIVRVYRGMTPTPRLVNHK